MNVQNILRLRNFFVVRCHIFDTEFVAFIDLLILAMTIKTVHDNVTFLPDMRLDVGSNLFSRLGLHLETLVTRGFS